MNKSIVKMMISVLLVGLMVRPGFAADGILVGSSKSDKELKQEEQTELRNLCISYRKDITEAKRKMAEACQKGGMGPNCGTQVAVCAKALGTEVFGSVSDVINAVGGAVLGGKGGACPQMGAAKYNEQKKEFEDRITEIKKDLENLPNDQADLEKEYNEKIQEMKEAETEANNDLEKLKSELNDEEIEQVQKFQESQRAAQKARRDSQSKLLELKASLSALASEKVARIQQFTGDLPKFSCLSQSSKTVQEYKKTLETTATQSNSAFIKGAKRLKQLAAEAYNACWEKFNQERIRLSQDMQSKQDLINDKIASTEDDIAAQIDAIESAQVSFEEIKKSKTNKENAAQKKVNELIALNKQKAMAAQYELETRLKGWATKQNNLNEALNRTTNSLSNLGPQPDPEAETAPKAAQPELAVQQEIISDILSDVESNPELSEVCHLSPSLTGKKKSRSKPSGSTNGPRGKR